MVQDQFITQGKAFFTAVAQDAAGVLIEGPTRIATKTDEILGDQKYAVLSHHLAQVINPSAGFQLTGLYTPIAPS